MFSWNCLAFLMIQCMLAIWSLVPLPFLNPAWTSGSSQFTYCWNLAWRILSITLLAWEMSTNVVWTFFGIAFLWDWNENWSFPVLRPLLSFPNLLAYWVQHFVTALLPKAHTNPVPRGPEEGTCVLFLSCDWPRVWSRGWTPSCKSNPRRHARHLCPAGSPPSNPKPTSNIEGGTPFLIKEDWNLPLSFIKKLISENTTQVSSSWVMLLARK